jgi:hypothetical protein
VVLAHILGEKMKTIIFAAIVLVSASSFALVQEKVEYTCSPFQADGKVLVGAHAPALVTIPNDLVGGTEFAIRLEAVVPNPKPTYEVLKLTGQGVDGSQWESQNYIVTTGFFNGSRATIQAKNSKVSATCVGVSAN